jgi:hypothetical protein
MRPFNLTGQPALSLCNGFDDGGLPLSLQIGAGPCRLDSISPRDPTAGELDLSRARTTFEVHVRRLLV